MLSFDQNPGMAAKRARSDLSLTLTEEEGETGNGTVRTQPSRTSSSSSDRPSKRSRSSLLSGLSSQPSLGDLAPARRENTSHDPALVCEFVTEAAHALNPKDDDSNIGDNLGEATSDPTAVLKIATELGRVANKTRQNLNEMERENRRLKDKVFQLEVILLGTRQALDEARARNVHLGGDVDWMMSQEREEYPPLK